MKLKAKGGPKPKQMMKIQKKLKKGSLKAHSSKKDVSQPSGSLVRITQKAETKSKANGLPTKQKGNRKAGKSDKQDKNKAPDSDSDEEFDSDAFDDELLNESGSEEDSNNSEIEFEEAESDGQSGSELDEDATSKKSKNKKKDAKKASKEQKPVKKNAFNLHKKDLESLKSIDPEFYTFLKQNDKKLLEFDFDDSDNDAEDGAESDEAQDDDDEEMIHKPSEQLEVASDESDFQDSDAEDDDDEEDDTFQTKTLTLKLLRKWQSELQDSKVHITTIRSVVKAFSSALASISDGQTGAAVYKVEGSAAFNGIIQLCVLYLQPGIYRFLGQHAKASIALHKCKKWKKIRAPLKSYLVDLSRLIEHVTSSNILRVLLKHLHQVAAMVGSFMQVSKPILKRLIVLWSTSEEETVRVLSFLCILKITRCVSSQLNHVLKAMYLAYVRNSKFVSPNSLPGINFMRRSLVEMFALDLNVAYQHAFLYIRQLAIHLRNAVILKKKDSLQAVYNWQFVSSIRLWSDLLAATTNKPQLQPLVYPLISITTGVIKLIPTAQYFPLRFHCIQSLITLQKQTNVFIPVLPLILEVLSSNTFNKKHTVVSMKPLSFACLLRLNKSQLAENGFRDEIVEQVCGLTLEYLAYESASLAYPDLIVPYVIGLKQYLKICKNANHSRKLKQLLDKIQENGKFVEQERRKINFTLKEQNFIQSWEATLRNKGTPLSAYYASWKKTHEIKKKRQAANTDVINDFSLPAIKRRKLDEKKHKDEDGPVELFPSGSEDEDVEEDELVKMQRKEKKKKQKKQKLQKKAVVNEEQNDVEEDDDGDDGVDIVKDLDLDDW